MPDPLFEAASTRVCSWESRQPPKLVHGVRILALVLKVVRSLRERKCRRGATKKGAGFVSRFMLVRIQSSALEKGSLHTPCAGMSAHGVSGLL